MAKATVEVLIDDLDGTDGAETITLGWNGEWRELELSKRNLSSLSRALDKYWKASRPINEDGQPRKVRRRPVKTRSSGRKRDPRTIRAWAADHGIAVPARGRIPSDVERQYNEAAGRS